MLENSGADCVQPVVRFSFPPQRCLVEEDGLLRFKWPEYRNARSQDLEPYYHDAGQFYCFRTVPYQVNRKLMLGNILPMIVSELEVQDIDSITDWEIAEIKYRLMKEADS